MIGEPKTWELAKDGTIGAVDGPIGPGVSGTGGVLAPGGPGGAGGSGDASVPAGPDGAGEPPGQAAPSKGGGNWALRAAKEIAFVALAAVVLSFVLKTFLVQSFFIPSQSMEDTLLIDDRVMVSKLAPGPFAIHRGDVVVFADPGGWLNAPDLPRRTGVGAWLDGALQALGLAPSTAENFLIKRVIGTEGDRVQCLQGGDGKNGVIQVNGTALDESSYIKPGQIPCDSALDITVPEDSLWVMGDNRGNSADSREHQELLGGGSVELDLVVGVAKLRTWPIDRMALLRNPGSVFAGVPAPEGR